MSPHALLLPALLLATACGTGLVPDESTAMAIGALGCPGDVAAVRAVVLDAEGLPVEGAEVVATHFGTEQTLVARTDAQGLTTEITSDLGQGSVVIHAFHGERESAPDAVLFTCTPCRCAADPAELTLQLGP